MDDELRESYTEVLSEFYAVFESIYKYAIDLNKYVEDVQDGLYIQMTLETILWDVEGRQLLVRNCILILLRMSCKYLTVDYENF